MAKLIYATGLTGGGVNNLDGSVSGADLTDGDMAVVQYGNEFYHYILDADSGLSESSPDRIAPDTSPGTKMWIRQGPYGAIVPYLVANYAAALAVDTDHDVTMSGTFVDSTNAYTMTLAAKTKQIDAAWAAGTDAGGLFSGTVANNTLYYRHVIRKDSDGTIDWGWDTSATAANKPAGYTAYRMAGFDRTDGSANLIAFDDIARGNEITKWWKARQVLVSGLTATTYTVQATTGWIPSGISNKEALFGGYFSSGDYQRYFHISSDGTNKKTIFMAAQTGASTAIGGDHELYQTGFSAPMFVPIIADQFYHKQTESSGSSGTAEFLIRATRFSI